MPTAAEMVSTIDSAISDITSGKAASRTVAGRTWTAPDLGELLKLREYYAGIVRGEDIAGGDKVPIRMMGIRFARES